MNKLVETMLERLSAEEQFRNLLRPLTEASGFIFCFQTGQPKLTLDIWKSELIEVYRGAMTVRLDDDGICNLEKLGVYSSEDFETVKTYLEAL